MFTRAFWRASTERALKSGAQFLLWTLGVGLVAGGVDSDTAQAVNLFVVDWVPLLGSAAGGIFISYLTSIISAGVTNGSPSLNDAESLNYIPRHAAK